MIHVIKEKKKKEEKGRRKRTKRIKSQKKYKSEIDKLREELKLKKPSTPLNQINHLDKKDQLMIKNNYLFLQVEQTKTSSPSQPGSDTTKPGSPPQPDTSKLPQPDQGKLDQGKLDQRPKMRPQKPRRSDEIAKLMESKKGLLEDAQVGVKLEDFKSIDGLSGNCQQLTINYNKLVDEYGLYKQIANNKYNKKVDELIQKQRDIEDLKRVSLSLKTNLDKLRNICKLKVEAIDLVNQEDNKIKEKEFVHYLIT